MILFFQVYLVKRFGGTPGKLFVGIRIKKVDGTAVGYREAILRCMPEFVFGRLLFIAFIWAGFQLTDQQYSAIAPSDRTRTLIRYALFYYSPLRLVEKIWFWSEFFVLLTNRKRRALHDFIAGTVVVHESEKPRLAVERIPA